MFTKVVFAGGEGKAGTEILSQLQQHHHNFDRLLLCHVSTLTLFLLVIFRTPDTHIPFLSPYPSLYRAPVSESAYSAYCRWPIAANWFLQLEARTHTHRSHVWLQKKTEMTQLWTWSSETCLALTSLVAQISTTCACDVSERGFCFYFLPRPTIDKLH